MEEKDTLWKQLETAIYNGEEENAARIARKLARLERESWDNTPIQENAPPPQTYPKKMIPLPQSKSLNQSADSRPTKNIPLPNPLMPFNSNPNYETSKTSDMNMGKPF